MSEEKPTKTQDGAERTAALQQAALSELQEKEVALVRELDRVLQPAIFSVSTKVRHRAEAVRGVATLFTATGETNYYGDLTRSMMARYDGQPNGSVLFYEPEVGWQTMVRPDQEGRVRYIRYRQVLPVLRLMVGMSHDILVEASDRMAVEALLHAIDELMQI